jgi:hypothetical protein
VRIASRVRSRLHVQRKASALAILQAHLLLVEQAVQQRLVARRPELLRAERVREQRDAREVLLALPRRPGEARELRRQGLDQQPRRVGCRLR